MIRTVKRKNLPSDSGAASCRLFPPSVINTCCQILILQLLSALGREHCGTWTYSIRSLYQNILDFNKKTEPVTTLSSDESAVIKSRIVVLVKILKSRD